MSIEASCQINIHAAKKISERRSVLFLSALCTVVEIILRLLSANALGVSGEENIQHVGNCGLHCGSDGEDNIAVGNSLFGDWLCREYACINNELCCFVKIV